jgi:hypothetical protein
MVRTGHWSQNSSDCAAPSTPSHCVTVVPGLGHRLAERNPRGTAPRHAGRARTRVRTMAAWKTCPASGRAGAASDPRPTCTRCSCAWSRDVRARPPPAALSPLPTVGALLAVDRPYVNGPPPIRCPPSRRFASIPAAEAWQPVLHAERDVLAADSPPKFSNTAQAHQLKRTRDWVRHLSLPNSEQFREASHWRGDGDSWSPGGSSGVVRGPRESECRAHYA